MVRSIINELISDFRQATLNNLEHHRVSTVDEVRHSPIRIAAFGTAVAEKNKELKRFLHKNMYSHRKVLRMEFKAELTLQGLFKAYTKMPGLLPEPVQKNSQWGSLERRICDYVSGMTDRYAINEHKNLYSADDAN